VSRQVGKWKDCAIVKERMEWSDLCLPAQIYPVVMAGLILFNVYGGHFRHAIHNSVALVVGTGFLWILCAAKFEFVAYAMLMMPVIFVIFLVALILFDQTLLEIHSKERRRGCGGRSRDDCGSDCKGDCDCS